MKLAKIVEALKRIAPVDGAQPWDNVGLIVGDPWCEVTKVLLAVDYTREVAEEAACAGVELVALYHPPIFKPLKRLTSESLVFDAVHRNVALYSLHTALDVADGGTNDVLADALGLEDREPLRKEPGKATHVKLVVFVPGADVERVSRAMFDAGAGRIGDYTSCSFRSPGKGTFFGEAGTSPAVGASGRLEEVDELRLETLVPVAKIAAVVLAMRAAHSYEEPAFDVVCLAPPPDSRGLGRIGRVAPVERAELVDRVKKALGLDRVLVAGPLGGKVERAAVCAGSCGDLLDDAIGGGAELYLTGELRHHDALRAAEAGLTIVCTLHSASERAVLPRLRARLAERLPGLSILLSEKDRDPFAFA
jgi:dinuclear metal center YbgI/SA1388 family protein